MWSMATRNIYPCDMSGSRRFQVFLTCPGNWYFWIFLPRSTSLTIRAIHRASLHPLHSTVKTFLTCSSIRMMAVQFSQPVEMKVKIESCEVVSPMVLFRFVLHLQKKSDCLIFAFIFVFVSSKINQSYISKIFSRYLHSPGSHQSTRFLELLTDSLTLVL